MKYTVLVLLLLPFFSLAQNKKITFDDIYRRGTFTAELVPGFHTMNDGKYFTETSETGLLKNNFITGETVETLIQATDVKDEKGEALSLDDIEWNNNEKKILIFTGREKIYRRSSKAIGVCIRFANKAIGKSRRRKNYSCYLFS